MSAALLSPAEIERLIDRQRNIVAPSTAAQRLLDLTSDPSLEVTPKEVAYLLQSEPSLSAHLLHWVNSALFSLSSPVAEIERAVTLVGLKRIRNLALSQAFLARSASGDLDVYGLPGLTFCLHSMETAVGAAYLMKQKNPAREAEAFTAGLLHDIGMLLIQGMANSTEKSAPLLPSERPIDEAERRRFGVDHCVLGAHLAKRWRLSKEQEAIIGGHHRTGQPAPRLEARYWPDAAGASATAGNDVARFVQVADRCSERRLAMTSYTSDEEDARLFEDVLEDEDVVTTLHEEMDVANVLLATLFGIEAG